MRIRSVAVLVLPSLLLCARVSAQSYTGSYTVQNQQGAMITLTLMQDAQGNISGTMSGNNQQYQVEGVLEEGTAVGAIYNDQGGVYFEAQLAGTQLQLTLIEPGPDNQPNYQQTQQLVLTRQGGGVGPAVQQQRPLPGGNPLAGGAAPAAGDPFAGTYTGDGVALELHPAQGGYAGSLTAQGQSYPVQARAAGGQLQGAFTVGGQQYGFQASVQGSSMTLVSDGTTYQLTRSGAGQAPANPLGRPGGAAAQATPQGTGSSLIGQWSCQSGEGPVQLAFVSERQLSYNGESIQYQLVGNAIRVAGEWGPMDYQYQLSGNSLRVSGADGTSLQCQRQQQGAAQAGGMPGVSAGGTGLERYLQGRVCSYSSSPDGGYSTQHLLEFDGQGRFYFGVETAWDIPETTGVSRNWGDGQNIGTYQVTGVNRGDAVYLRFPDGRVGTARVYHVYQGEVTELFLEGPDRHYGKSLCP